MDRDYDPKNEYQNGVSINEEPIDTLPEELYGFMTTIKPSRASAILQRFE